MGQAAQRRYKDAFMSCADLKRYKRVVDNFVENLTSEKQLESLKEDLYRQWCLQRGGDSG